MGGRKLIKNSKKILRKTLRNNIITSIMHILKLFYLRNYICMLKFVMFNNNMKNLEKYLLLKIAFNDISSRTRAMHINDVWVMLIS